MRIKVMVASNDEILCNKLREDAAFTKNKMEVLAWVTSGEEVFERFEEANPRLLIIDSDIKGMDAVTCIERVHKIKAKCRILVIGNGNDAVFMQELFKIKVSGYIAKPLDIEAVNAELKYVSEDIRRVTQEAINCDTAIAMQSLYFWELMFDTGDMAKDMKFINRTLETNFKEGKFRVVLLRIDQLQGDVPNFEHVEYYDDLHRMQQYIKATISQYIYEYCYEMIFDFQFNGVLSLLNYDSQYENIILNLFDELKEEIYRFTTLNFGMTVTVCVGEAYEDFAKVHQSREEAYSAAWSRMKQGTGKILYYHKKYDSQQLYQQELKKIVENLKLTADTLNVHDFHKIVKELFSLPDYVLLDYKSRDYILGFVDDFFDINSVVLSQHMNVEQRKENIKKTLNFSYTLENYQRNLEQKFDELFELLALDAEKQNIRPLRKAIKYIKENYNKPITSETLADIVSLSPVYFSHLFKKHVGMNMTDYITEYRMEIAKKMLFETEMTIYEVSTAVGFQDQRYFSKRFKQIVGKTPTEYRKMK